MPANDRLPALIEATKEYAMMARAGYAPIEMTILPNQQDPLLWNGLWFVHEGRTTLRVYPIISICPMADLLINQVRIKGGC
jgi:hypothetical protein